MYAHGLAQLRPLPQCSPVLPPPFSPSMSKGYAPCCNLCCEGLARWCGGRGRARWLGEGRGLGEGTRRGSFASRGDDARLLCEVASTERRRRRAACTALHCTARAGHRPGPRRQGERAATLGGRCKAQARSMRVPTDTFDTFDSSSCPPPSIVAVAREVVVLKSGQACCQGAPVALPPW